MADLGSDGVRDEGGEFVIWEYFASERIDNSLWDRPGRKRKGRRCCSFLPESRKSIDLCQGNISLSGGRLNSSSLVFPS